MTHYSLRTLCSSFNDERASHSMCHCELQGKKCMSSRARKLEKKDTHLTKYDNGIRGSIILQQCVSFFFCGQRRRRNTSRNPLLMHIQIEWMMLFCVQIPNVRCYNINNNRYLLSLAFTCVCVFLLKFNILVFKANG